MGLRISGLFVAISLSPLLNFFSCITFFLFNFHLKYLHSRTFDATNFQIIDIKLQLIFLIELINKEIQFKHNKLFRPSQNSEKTGNIIELTFYSSPIIAVVERFLRLHNYLFHNYVLDILNFGSS